jgi:hypothetical protein
VFEDVENQPAEGTAFQSQGHYGSTVFDPMDGSYIEINVCDDCLRKHAPDRVLCGRNYKPVLFEGSVVGRCRTPGRGLVAFDPDTMGSFDKDDVLHLWPDELEDMSRFPEIELNPGLTPEILLRKEEE